MREGLRQTVGGWLVSAGGRLVGSRVVDASTEGVSGLSVEGRRRWESAKTNRLNREHWGRSGAQSLNRDLSDHLETLRNRCLLEESNNGYLRGMLETHETDLFGGRGPTLQVQTTDGSFADELEHVWKSWWARCDLNSQWTGTELLGLCNRNRWLLGEYLVQLVSGSADEAGVRLRLLAVDPRRLVTPVSRLSDEGVLLGVERDRTGRPLGYFVTTDGDGVSSWSLRTERVSAAHMIHRYDLLEAGQVRGVPVLAPVLQAVADLRDFDVQVMDAARAAADMGIYMSTIDPTVEYKPVNSNVEIERRTMRTLPPGWRADMLQAEQPSTGYNDFVDAQLRGIGRAASMPLMMVKLDSREHNYSSARFDHQLYVRSLQKLQGRYEVMLNRLVGLVALEAQASGSLRPAPNGWRAGWTWPSPPHVDPLKEAKAEEQRLRNGTQSLAGACAGHGQDWEEVLKQRQRESVALAEAGLGAPWEEKESVRE